MNILNPINIVKGRVGGVHYAEQNKSFFFSLSTKFFNSSVSIMGVARQTGPRAVACNYITGITYLY